MDKFDDISHDSTNRQVLELQSIIHQLKKEKSDLEKDFGLKRAKFKELYLKKEDELLAEQKALLKANQEIESLRAQVKSLQAEIDDSHSLVAALRYQKDNDLEVERQRCQEEIASLQHILKEAVADAIQSTQNHYEKEIKKLKKINEKLEADLTECRLNQGKDREGVLAVMTKSLRQRVGGLGSPIPFGTTSPSSSAENAENLEESMKKAQEDAEMLRNLVLPLEEEIKALKDKLRHTDNQLQVSEGAFSILLHLFPLDVVHAKLREHASSGSAELASLKQKIDMSPKDVTYQELQMFVTFVHIQNNLLQRHLNQLKQELSHVQQQLQKEQKDHAALQRTWQIVNDQFLETQRLHHQEMKRVQSLLTPEQTQQFTQQQKLQRSQKQATQHFSKERESKIGLEMSSIITKLSPMVHRRYGSADNKSIDLVKEQQQATTSSNRCQSMPEKLSDVSLAEAEDKKTVPQPSAGPQQNNTPVIPGTQSGPLWRSRSLDRLHKSMGSVPKAASFNIDFSAPKGCSSFETEASSSMGTRAGFSSESRKICELCSMYKHQVEKLKLELHTQKTHSQTLEEELRASAQETQTQVSSLKQKHTELLSFLLDLRKLHESLSAEIFSQLKDISSERDDAKQEINKLQQENEMLLGKHLSRSQQLQNEIIDFPDNLEEMQFMCLKLREDLITALESREKVESMLRTENLFLQEQLHAEQSAKLEMSTKLSALRDQAEKNQEQTLRRSKLDEKIQNRLFSYHPGETTTLQTRVDELLQIKGKLEEENQELRSKVVSLQNDLSISEGVQKDFVKLSQTLQMELEKIRQQGTEVRWQHEDDVEECNGCKELFSNSRREKIHCSHCGQIFCPPCCSKIVYSGPNQRPFKVCRVCHTLLDHTSAPYFSRQPLHSPL